MEVCMGKYIKKHFVIYATTVFIGIVFSVVNIYMAFLLNQVIDVVIAKDFSTFYYTIGKTILYFVCITVCYYLYLLLVKRTIKVVLRDLRYDVFKGIISQNYNSFYSVNTADYISSISNDINIIEETYLIPSIYGIQQVGILLGAFAALLSLSPIITICLLMCVLLAMFFPSLYSRVLQKRQKKYSEQLSNFTKLSKDYFSGFEVIKSFNLLDNIFQKFSIENTLLANMKMKKDNAFNINESISFFFSFFSQLLILLVGAYLILVDNITIGMLVAIIQLSNNFVNPISNVMQAFSKVKSTRPIRDKLSVYASYYTDDKINNRVIVFNDKITLNNVCFSHDDKSKFQLQCINLSIPKGGKYVIVYNGPRE
jgi:ABC-type multidrug transport system fused ATPase/permease subunit